MELHVTVPKNEYKIIIKQESPEKFIHIWGYKLSQDHEGNRYWEEAEVSVTHSSLNHKFKEFLLTAFSEMKKEFQGCTFNSIGIVKIEKKLENE